MRVLRASVSNIAQSMGVKEAICSSAQQLCGQRIAIIGLLASMMTIQNKRKSGKTGRRNNEKGSKARTRSRKSFRRVVKSDEKTDNWKRSNAVREKSEKTEDLVVNKETLNVKAEDSSFIEKEKMAYTHFDVDDGTIAYADSNIDSSEVVCECTNCGTILEFEAEKCPFCGNHFDKRMVGIADIDTGAEIGNELAKQINSDILCPICGILTHLNNGRCDGCDTQLITADDNPEYRFRPLVPVKSVVFIHLDVELGKISYFCKGTEELRAESLTPRLERIGTDVVNGNWESMDGM